MLLGQQGHARGLVWNTPAARWVSMPRPTGRAFAPSRNPLAMGQGWHSRSIVCRALASPPERHAIPPDDARLGRQTESWLLHRLHPPSCRVPPPRTDGLARPVRRGYVKTGLSRSGLEKTECAVMTSHRRTVCPPEAGRQSPGRFLQVEMIGKEVSGSQVGEAVFRQPDEQCIRIRALVCASNCAIRSRF